MLGQACLKGHRCKDRFNLLALISLLLAAALPRALAWDYKPDKPWCDKKTYEIYRKDLVNKSDLEASADAVAVGKKTFTYVDQWAFITPNSVHYTAYLTAYAKYGHILLYNSGSAYVLDCDKIIYKEYVDHPRKYCVYEVDYYSRVACTKAIAHWSGHAYAYGGNAVGKINTSSLVAVGISATYTKGYAAGSEGAGLDVHQFNGVDDNSAGASAHIDSVGDSAVIADVSTVATDHSSSSSSTIKGSSKIVYKKPSYKKPPPKKRSYKGRHMLEEE